MIRRRVEDAVVPDPARRLAVPTLVVGGARSELVSPIAVDEPGAAIAQALTTEVSETGHVIIRDENDTVTAAETMSLSGLP